MNDEQKAFRPTVAVDFDGVVHAYSQGWADGSIYDPPIPGAFNFLANLINAGYDAYIHSTREPEQIVQWLNEYHLQGDLPYPAYRIPDDTVFWNGPGIGVSNRKLPAIAYVDDRGVKFDGSFADTLTRIEELVADA